MEEELSKILWKLSHDIADIVKTLKENGKIRKVKRLWFRERITNFEYKEGNIMNARFSFEYFEREEWDWKDWFQIIEPEIKKLPTYVTAYITMFNSVYENI
jgi:hypothetical protein